VQLLVNEKRSGKEQIAIVLGRLVADTPPAAFGDPIASRTGYALCVYDPTDRLVAALRVDRAGTLCGNKPCWKSANGRGWKYTDKRLGADGVLQLLLKSGAPGKGKVVAKAKNDAAKGSTAMPTGVAASLAGNGSASAVVQLRIDGGGCMGGTAQRVRQSTDRLFKATAP
jgi:hypothetical protein